MYPKNFSMCCCCDVSKNKSRQFFPTTLVLKGQLVPIIEVRVGVGLKDGPNKCVHVLYACKDAGSNRTSKQSKGFEEKSYNREINNMSHQQTLTHFVF